MLYYADINGQKKKIKLARSGDSYKVEVDDISYEVDTRRLDPVGALSLIIANRCYEASITNTDRTLLVCILGEKFEVNLKDELEYQSDEVASHHAGLATEEVRAPMPGVVVSIEVEQGQEITAGTPVVIVEAMKMQNEISAVTAGTVKRIFVKEGDVVDSRQTLAIIDRA